MNFRSILIFLVLAVLLLPGALWAAKCTRVLPNEVFAFFGEKRSDVDCDDYEYKMVDLNDDGQLEVVATNYRRSCEDAGYCNFEIFEKADQGWKHIATIPGRFRLLPTKTNGYHDLATWLLGHRYVYVWNGRTYHDINRPEANEGGTQTPTPQPDRPPASDGAETG